MRYPQTAALAWILIGIYGYFANRERVRRVYSTGDHFAQSLSTFFLGPLGIFLVMSQGGHWLFWREQ